MGVLVKLAEIKFSSRTRTRKSSWTLGCLKEIIEEVKPKSVFPIHGEHPELFSKFMRGLDSEITISEKGRGYEI